MPKDLRKARELFLHAVGKLPPEQWDGYVAEACDGDADLQQQVGCLLQVHREAGSFLDAPAPGLDVTEIQPLVEKPGALIGPYKLLEQIGEGGMGVVFMAEQTRPVQRRVALKIIKAGMDTREVVARFEAERQALAMMDHPNIARVLDAGATDTGRPYFVMELVRGVPVTEFSNQKNLTIRERLELFVTICQAVQHAHQKGIIHRDIKPTNVLVTLHDGRPVIKVIDFGVAKATAQKLTDRTLFTGFTQMIGTPLYMSPEQAEMSGLDVDTRSDIFSAGVLLYELLTGTTPFDNNRLKIASVDELRRIIREEEPPRPSTRLTTLALEAASTIGTQRKSDSRQLSRLVHGELDWIVMKCLEKDRTRRYETAGALAGDVERYLHDEPILACPPSAGYRLRKFARRNKTGLAVVGLVLFCLVLMGGGVGWLLADRAAQQREAESKLLEALTASEPLLREGNPGNMAMLSAAERIAAQLARGVVRADVRRRGEQFLRDVRMLAELDETRLRQAETNDGAMFDLKGAETAYAAAFGRYGIEPLTLEPSEAASRIRASAIREALLMGLDGWIQIKSEHDLSRRRLAGVADAADDNAWRRAFRQAVLARDVPKLNVLLGEPEAVAQPPSVLALTLRGLGGSSDQVPTLLRQAQQRHPADFWLNYQLGYALIFGQAPEPLEEAVGYCRAAVASRPSSAEAHSLLGLALYKKGDTDSAIAAYRHAVELDPKFVTARVNLGHAYMQKGEPSEAMAEFREATEADSKDAPVHNSLGYALEDQGKLVEAAAQFRMAIKIDDRFAPAHYNLGVVLARKGQLEEAASAFDRGVALEPTNHDGWCLAAALHAGAGDVEGYRRTCREILKRFGDTAHPQSDDVIAKACLLLPDDLPGAEFDRVQRLAERAVTGTENDGYYRCFMLTKALADYRAGRQEEAVMWLERFTPLAEGWHWDATAFAILAMADRRLGRTEQAAAVLAKAEAIMARMPDPAKEQSIKVGDLFIWLHARILCHEAEEMMKKESGVKNQESEKNPD